MGRVIVTPGNGGTVGAGLESRSGSILDVAAAIRPDLVVVGPEQPLCDGIVDELSVRGFVVYGPSRKAAQLEGSKAFMKDFALRHGIATAHHVTMTGLTGLERAIQSFEHPPVVKATGLCAGKGVVVAESHEEALMAARGMLSGADFGEAGRVVVLEERLYGQEVSVHAVCDGETALVLPPIQDHKRIGDGDVGPNTGGMGTYGPAPVVTPELASDIERDVIGKIVRGMAADGAPFRGTLFANVMVDSRGAAKLLEINVRFGDPETQVLMNLIEGDLGRLLRSAAEGRLDPSTAAVSSSHAMCVVLAAAGYPAEPRKGDPIHGVEDAEAVEGVQVYHAGTRRDGERLVTAGGRVLGVTATAPDLRRAQAAAYSACERIRFDGMQFRRDIGHHALATGVGA
jgi:phosphoribosylamine--glycine ligase